MIKKNTPLEIKNKGIEARQKNDITEEEADLLRQSKYVRNGDSFVLKHIFHVIVVCEFIDENFLTVLSYDGYFFFNRLILEAKSKLYDKLSSGILTEEEKECNKRFLVRFDKKNNSDIRNPSLINFEDLEQERYPESDDEDRYQSDEGEVNKDPGERW